VTPDFFRMMGIALVDGRTITRQDDAHGQAIVMVNEAFAKRNFGNASAVGERIKSLKGHMENGKFVDDLVPIVGVVHDVKYATLSGPTEPVLYEPFAQFFFQRATIVVATADGVPERHADDFKAALWRVDRRLAIESASVPAIVAASLDRERLGMWLMLGFGAAALVLAAAGVFGVIAYVVSQRMGEMAVRQALGATQGQILTTVLRDGGVLVVGGLVLGVGVAWWMGRLVSGYIFGVNAHDPFVLGSSVAVVAVLAIVATLLPARRATGLELARALRGD
jgi:hypothetical protein